MRSFGVLSCIVVAWLGYAHTSMADEPASRRVVNVTFAPDVDRAELQQFDGEGGWVTVCPGGCAMRLPAEGSYRIGGNGVVKSSPFRLPPEREAVTIRAEVGTTSKTGWGIVLAGGGAGVALFVGLPLLMAGAFIDAAEDAGGTGSNGKGITITGGVITAGGLVLGIAGLMMILNNGTDVTMARLPSTTRNVARPAVPPQLGFRF